MSYFRKKTKSAPVSSTAAISRSYSASDLSLAGTSLLHKTNIGEARPITSRKLKKALSKSTQDLKAAAITPRVNTYTLEIDLSHVSCLRRKDAMVINIFCNIICACLRGFQQGETQTSLLSYRD